MTTWHAMTPAAHDFLAAAAADPRAVLVAMDFDGTLAPIVDDPETSAMQPEAAEALAVLGPQVGHLAILTGRPVAKVRQLGQLERRAGLDGVVVLGRNATVILADHPGALHVKLDGPLEQRVARAAAEASIPLAEASRRQAREDRVRAEMSLRLYNWDPRSNDRFDLVINTGLVGLDAAVELILEALRVLSRRPS